ncbi:carbamoyltransferase HypF [Microbulbifer marinus]|nr:carbamoyltransferase HypF [Microbulbifer marinus]
MTSERWHIAIGGLVQGVGFRPFVYRLAKTCNLSGWVLNDSHGVQIEVQGDRQQLRNFLHKLRKDKPPLARISSLTTESRPPCPETNFRILNSDGDTPPSATILPDLAPCPDCLREMFAPDNRRFRYPFTSCTQCGPRFSIAERLPYDRANTTMRDFPLCESCRIEYEDPQNRRFHAEPNACPTCGPQLQLCDANGRGVAVREDALKQARQAIEAGQIVALKSIGGFQLLVDASNSDAVLRLRARKRRPLKPFALLYPDVESVEQDCSVSDLEKGLLEAQERPIVLLAARGQARRHVAAAVAPDNPNLGVMLPSSPLHHLLIAGLQRPLVATSGNLSGEPICYDNGGAIERLGAIADLFLLHDRSIARPLDDSVVREMDGSPVVLRRARGYAPLPVELPVLPDTFSAGDLLAVGADLKNTAAISRGRAVYVTQHIGDLQNRVAREVFEQAVDDLAGFYRSEPAAVIADLHPAYVSSRWARQRDPQYLGAQHHVAHFFSCMAEHGYRGRALGICWDGTGWGADGIVRGGEFLCWDGREQVQRIAGLRTFPLPGGEGAIREPRRQAAGLLYAVMGERAFAGKFLLEQFSAGERHNLARMFERKINSPLCSSAGRLFDGVAALLGLANAVTFEGQAAMAVEFAAQQSATTRSYPFAINQHDSCRTLDWEPLVAALLQDGEQGVSVPDRARAFHNTLAQMMCAMAVRAGEENIFLSGGVFQNRVLTESAATLLRQEGFRVHCHCVVPPNDGGIALGQIYYARCMAAARTPAEEGSRQCV